jgi:NADH-quinone oxidoreductase subunit H
LIPFTDLLTGISLPAGALFVFALSSVSVIGMVMSGWGSANKYSLIGGMRSAAQAISYEIPLVLSVLAVVLFTGSMDLKAIVEAQKAHAFAWLWISVTPISFLIFLIASTAEVNRIPFDLPEAESELVSGYNTEYTGMKFALFFLAEYAALFAMCTLTVIFFFGGYYSPFGGLLTETLGWGQAAEQVVKLPGFGELLRQLEMVIWMISKVYVFIFLAMWIRGTLPRLKPDQLMSFSWKFLIPLSLLNLVFVTLEKYAVITQTLAAWGAWAVVLVAGVTWFVTWYSNRFTRQLQARLRPL